MELHGAERESFLVRACGADGALRSEVDALLQADVSSDGFTHFIDSGIVGELVGGRLASSIDGARIGTYRVNRVIATGGMGTVYEATQENPTRTVALKMMRAGLESPDAVRRFRYECETLARLRHPGIAQIYEAGVYRVAGREEPLPFFAMEYVEDARTLIDFVQSHRLSTHAALELFLAICEAVNDAHQKGVIHRDLKPANILVDAAGRPKIIDFGIARTVTTDAPAQTLETQAGQIVGTVQYMSPEQAEGSREDVDTRSDVYSLGAILFQMLSGRLPYYLENCSITDVVRIVRNEPPIRLGSLVPSLAGDLEWITLKALEKEKARRYESAAALADDVRRHLRNEPVIAGPPSAVYRLRKFVRRHRVAVAAATTVVVALVAGIVATSLALRRAVRAEATARTAKDRAEQSLKRASGALDFLTETFRAADPDKSGRDVRVADRLAAAAADVGKRFADDPATEASIREAIGNTYVGLGLFREAEVELRHALERWDAVTATTEDVRGARIVTALDLGTALDSEDRLDEAEALDRRTLDESRAVLGPNDETTLTLAGNLAVVLKKSKKFEESEALYRETLATSARVLGDDDSLTLTLATNLSTLLLMKEDHAEGEAMLRQTLEKLKRRYGESDLQTLTAMHSLANLLREDGKLTEAERLARTIVERLSQVLGDTHRDTLLATVTLAEILEKQGRQD
ncbi:MAG: serine/threonine protein kinase, partial [Planctomycetes bacterium]|nr:serine/threonine protein kinase [Planctomycetota bacterium]